jgi:KDO2-lipid IV(A) lauroyltransferase
MARSDFLNSKLSIQISILIGKYLPKKIGYGISRNIGLFIATLKKLEISRAIRANQYIANGLINSSEELVEKSKRVLTHAGKCYVDLYQVYNEPETLDTLVPLTKSMRDFIDISHQKQGYMVVAPHLSNFDLILSSLVKHGFIGKVLSFPNPGSGYQLQNEIRESFGMDILPLGNPSLEAVIVEHLRNGGIAATGIDRPVPGRKKRHYVKFFDRPSPLPLGYITTALAAEVPVIVVTAIMEPDGSYGFRSSEPIELKKYQNKLDDIRLNAERVLKRVEEFIKLAPEQWLMYYPVWPDILKEGL